MHSRFELIVKKRHFYKAGKNDGRILKRKDRGEKQGVENIANIMN